MSIKPRRQCSICDELEGSVPNRLSPLLSGSPNAILHETETLALIPSVGPLVRGHCLIVPKAHSCNLILSVEPSRMHELHFMLNSVRRCFSGRGNPKHLFCFEHGKQTTEDGDTLCSTSHGHLHVLPLIQSQIGYVLERLSMSIPTRVPTNLFLKQIKEFQEYIAAFVWQDCPRSTGVMSAKGLPSQYLRKLIAEAVGIAQWDWKEDPRIEIIKDTIADFGGLDMRSPEVEVESS